MTVYTQSFETDFGNWVSSGFTGWTRDSGGTASPDTGPSAAYDGSYYVYVECTDGQGSYTAGDEDFLTYTKRDANLAVNLVAFAYHQYGTNQGTLELQSGNDTDGWTTVWSSTGDQGNQWNTASVTITGRAEDTVRFKNTAAGDYRGDVALDLIEVTEEAPRVPQTVTATLVDRAGSPQANLTGLKWAWHDASPVQPGNLRSPISSGTSATTDANGNLSLSILSNLTAGQSGTLILETGDGASKAIYSGPFTLGTRILDNPKDVNGDVYFTDGVGSGGGGGGTSAALPTPVMFIITT